MSAIHDAARTVEQAAQAEQAKLTAILQEAEDLQLQIGATGERLRNLRDRLTGCTEDLTAQRLVNEQAGKLAEVARRLEIKATPAEVGPTPIADGITRESLGTLAFEAVVPCRHCGAAIHEVRDKQTGELWAWAHTHQDLVACNLVVPGARDTHAEPPAPAVQQGTEGSPLLTTVLPPRIAEEVRTDG